MPTPDSTPGTTGGQDASLLKVLENWDALALGFGAMIGFGWVVLTGGWISAAGTGGGVLAMVTGGVIMGVVGLTYAELAPAMPRREASSTSCSGAWGRAGPSWARGPARQIGRLVVVAVILATLWYVMTILTTSSAMRASRLAARR